MNIRRVVLDVDMARERPSVVEIAKAIHEVNGVEAVNLYVEEIDLDTVGLVVAVEGEDIDFDALVAAIEFAGAAAHGAIELVTGVRAIERGAR
jgi:hypothetical protein